MNFKNICVTSSVFAIPLFCHAQSHNNLNQIPPGVTIVKSININLPENIQRELNEKRIQLKQNGYFSTDSQSAIELIKMRTQGVTFSEKNEKDDYGTDMKKSLSNIKLAFPFKKISLRSQSNIIGYAVAGTYKDGWTGIAEFFITENIGVCEYLVNNIAVTKGGILLKEDSITYDVNKKPTTILIEGSKQSGFLYNIEWYDNTYIKNLKCANYVFDKEITNKMISFSKKIDIEY